MGLFQRNREVATASYVIKNQKNILVIGLGNPGKEHEFTRHNIGYLAVDNFAQGNEFPKWQTEKKLSCSTCDKRIGNTRVILAKPTTYMNNSGQAVSKLQHYYKISNIETLVVYDELALAFGQIRARSGGSAAGHNGIKSLIEHVGPDFGRLRIGVAGKTTKPSAAEYVLSNFSRDEQSKLAPILSEASNMINEFIYSGDLAADTRTVF